MAEELLVSDALRLSGRCATSAKVEIEEEDSCTTFARLGRIIGV